MATATALGDDIGQVVQLVAGAVGQLEPGHVLHDTEDLLPGLESNRSCSFGDLGGRGLRGRDHEDLGAGDELGDGDRDVTGARRQIEEQDVEIAPEDVGEELLHRHGGAGRRALAPVVGDARVGRHTGTGQDGHATSGERRDRAIERGYGLGLPAGGAAEQLQPQMRRRAGAGGAAHLPGMVAAATPLPVIGIPRALKDLDGLDSLLSIVQMPSGVPVATVSIGGAKNAGLLAVRILGAGDPALQDKMVAYQEQMADEVEQKDKNLRSKLLGE